MPTKSRPHPLIALLLFMTACYGVAFLGTQATLSSIGFWYITLNKPSWNPPTWLFAPVWTVLYGLMAWAAWLVWSVPEGVLPSGKRTRALILFFAQLILNGLWSWLFFYWRLLLPAALEIGLLWLAILATLVIFWRTRPLAGILLIPYILWVTFAAALNIAIWKMNR